MNTWSQLPFLSKQFTFTVEPIQLVLPVGRVICQKNGKAPMEQTLENYCGKTRIRVSSS